MNDHYFEDPTEEYESDGDAHFHTERNFDGQHAVASGGPFTDDYYEDVIDLELSSPTPVPKVESGCRHFDHREPAYMRSITPISHTEGPSYHHQKPSIGKLYAANDFLGTFTRNENQNNTYDQSSQPSKKIPYNGTRSRHNSPNAYDSVSQNVPQPNPRNAHGVRLRPVTELPDVYRGLFKFGVFNAVQSTCFNEVFAGKKNLVISAPTGSGKTVLFELGIIQMAERSKITGKQAKCVYIAPTKALCSERFQDWVVKFEPIGLKCCELTGDTVVIGHNTWSDAKNASIIVTTCEKWDSLTRNWHDHDRVLSQIQLFLVDEVHILNESRGSTLEVVTSRMKLRANSIRFILVSATVPNIQDVACWIGGGCGTSEAAQVFEFGDAYRPCQLTRHVVGVHRRNGYNDFQFAKVLDGKLFSVLQQFSVGKPILVFCSTRKGVFDSAEQIMKEYTDTEARKASLPWSRPARITHSFNDNRLDGLACAGIGVHHAGISMDDRRATEQLYLKKVLRILVATSTLAVGVNLPAHMVVIKGVRTFQNNASKEYSDLDVMQMLGRAGRPQFDKDGIAIILCESELENKYRALVQGKTILESCLHINLAEHLNSEIGLGTITDVESAKGWLRSSFLYQRMQRNPKYYALSSGDAQKREEDVENVVMESIEQLKKTLLIEHVQQGGDVGKLSSTQYGEIMSRYYIRRATMDLILALPERASLREILESICGAEELQDVKLRGSEKSLYNTLRKDTEIRFEVKRVEKTVDKVFLLVQAVLGGISLNSQEYRSSDSQPHMEAFTVFKHISRISRAALEVAVVKKDGLQMKNGFELFRCLSSKAWEDRAVVFKQIEQIGEKSIKVLAEHGITSFAVLRKQSQLRIETLLNRRHPFGLEVLASVAEFPEYVLRVIETGVRSDGGEHPVTIDLLIECGLTEQNVISSKPRKQRNRAFQMTAVLTLTSDMELIDLRRIPTKSLKCAKAFEVTAELTKPSQSVIVILTSETIAGVALQHVYKPSVSPSEYPTRDTRPISSVELDLVGLDDDPEFWNMGIDSSDVTEHPPVAKFEDDNKKSTMLQVANEPHDTQSRPEKYDPRTRLDDRYECNHSCKDKTKCRHLCCRDGLPKPPHTSKKKPQNLPESSSQRPSTVQRLHVLSKTTAATQKLEKESQTLKALNLIHERTKVANNLNLGEGQRLKLESPRPSKRKRRPCVEYDISFTDLADPRLVNSKIDFPEDDSDSEDLPEAVIPTSTFTNQANEDIESGYTSRECISPQVRSHQLTSSNTTGEEKTGDRHRNKRVKYSGITPVSKKGLASEEEVLFLESSDNEDFVKISTPLKAITSDQNSNNKMKTEVDRRRTNVPFGRLIPPVNRTQSSSSASVSSGLVPSPRWKNDAKINVEIEEEVEATAVEGDTEFVELDAWLQSGFVDIL